MNDRQPDSRTPDEVDRLEALFAELAPLDPERRARRLEELTPGRVNLRTELQELLDAHDAFASSEVDEDAEAAETLSPGPVSPQRLGSFAIIEKIGEGGMGEVFRAERADGQFTQQVAIKLTRTTLGSIELKRRFGIERQALASLDHEHIVRLIDAGTAPSGQAFLVMEFVEGVPITAFCRDRALGLDARLDLFRQVCRAVQHAHQHGIVHRDLKPANILVRPDGAPKIVDFGVAKLLEDDALPGATRTGRPGPLTPNYASPEQLRGLPVTTASDIYSLGVILYELLAGVRPYETDNLPLERVLDLVVHDEPRRPSAAWPDGGAHRPPESGDRLRGDLDAIVLKALHKLPAARYASAGELASDVDRYLAGDPVLARVPTTGYVLRRLARRHRRSVVVAAVALVAVLSASAAALWQWQSARRAQARAEQRFQQVRQLANTLIFDIHDAVRPLAGSTPVRQRIVAEALNYLEQLSKEADDAALRLELAKAYHRIGDVQGNPTDANLGDRTGAIASFRRAIDLLAVDAAASAQSARTVVRAQTSLALTANAAGRVEEATAAWRDAERTVEALLAVNPRDDEARRSLGTVYFLQASLSSWQAARPHWLKAAAVFEALLTEQPDDGDRQRNVALMAKYLGENYRLGGDLERAIAQHTRAKELDERRVAADPTNRQAQLDLALDWGSLGGAHLETGDRARAVESLERSLAIRQQLAASDPQDDFAQGRLAHAHALLGRTYRELARLSDAQHHLRESVRVTEQRRALDAQSRLLLAGYLMDLSDTEADLDQRRSACLHLDRAARLLADASQADARTLEDRPGVQRDLDERLPRCRVDGGR